MASLNALRDICGVVHASIQEQIHHGLSTNGKESNCRLLEQAADTALTTTRIIADVTDLTRFHEGATLKTKFRLTNLRDVGLEAIKSIRCHALRLTGRDDDISISLKLIDDGGPSGLYTDQVTLLRVLAHLLENAVRAVDSGGQVTLHITSNKSNTLFEVIDNGKGLPPGTCLDQGYDLNDIMSDRHYIGSIRKSLCFSKPDEVQKVRNQMEEKLRSLKQTGVGVGLPLAYHLVHSLGGDLKHDSLHAEKGARIWFVLPALKDNDSEDVEAGNMLVADTIIKKDLHPPELKTCGVKRKDIEEPNCSNESSNDISICLEDPNYPRFCSDRSDASEDETSVLYDEPAAVAVAACGVRASMPFSVLVVEDTDIRKSFFRISRVFFIFYNTLLSVPPSNSGARLLLMRLKKMKCSALRVENGRMAADLLRDSVCGTFDMVLIPAMVCVEAIKLMRRELQMKDLPIIVVTGELSADVRSQCEAIGVDGFVGKRKKGDQLKILVETYKKARYG